jgi:hypothetical protein
VLQVPAYYALILRSLTVLEGLYFIDIFGASGDLDALFGSQASRNVTILQGLH